jgi:hypothetical protein
MLPYLTMSQRRDIPFERCQNPVNGNSTASVAAGIHSWTEYNRQDTMK